MEELQAYCALSGSLLSAEDKKRVLLECEATGSGALTVDAVSKAIRLLGSGFFQEMTGLKRSKGKTYNSSALAAEAEEEGEPSNSALGEEWTEDRLRIGHAR